MSRRDGLRLLALILAPALVGLASNALSARPVPLLDVDGPGAPPVRAPRISASAWREERAKGKVLVVLDVRDKRLDGAPEGAIQLPPDAFMAAYERRRLGVVLKAADGVVVLCEGGDCPLGDRVATRLIGLGHRGVRVFDGGWPAWKAAELPRSEP